MSSRLVATDSEEQPESRFAKDTMARLWKNAPDRETGAEAVEAIRARRRQEREASAANQGGRLQRFIRGRS